MDPKMMAMMGGGMGSPAASAPDAPPDMAAVIAALEQARAALDEVEAVATGQRRDKAKMPPEVESPAEEQSPDEEQE
jgi:hypothetical protein